MINEFGNSKREINEEKELENIEHMSAEEAMLLFASESLEMTMTRGETSEIDELSELFYEKFPLEREVAAKKAFDNAPEEYKRLLEKSKEGLSIHYSKNNEGCYYFENGVYMMREMDEEEYADVLRHEISHYLDEQQGWYSENMEYINAVYDDTMMLNFSDAATKEYREKMLEELFNSDVCYNRHVSDILSAVSHNDPGLVFKYGIEGVPYYRHKSAYFEKGHNRENEIYADIMACISENDVDTVYFIQKYFPNIYKETRKSMEDNNNE